MNWFDKFMDGLKIRAEIADIRKKAYLNSQLANASEEGKLQYERDFAKKKIETQNSAGSFLDRKF